MLPTPFLVTNPSKRASKGKGYKCLSNPLISRFCQVVQRYLLSYRIREEQGLGHWNLSLAEWQLEPLWERSLEEGGQPESRRQVQGAPQVPSGSCELQTARPAEQDTQAGAATLEQLGQRSMGPRMRRWGLSCLQTVQQASSPF